VGRAQPDRYGGEHCIDRNCGQTGRETRLGLGTAEERRAIALSTMPENNTTANKGVIRVAPGWRKISWLWRDDRPVLDLFSNRAPSGASPETRDGESTGTTGAFASIKAPHGLPGPVQSTLAHRMRCGRPA